MEIEKGAEQSIIQPLISGWKSVLNHKFNVYDQGSMFKLNDKEVKECLKI